MYFCCIHYKQDLSAPFLSSLISYIIFLSISSSHLHNDSLISQNYVTHSQHNIRHSRYTMLPVQYYRAALFISEFDMPQALSKHRIRSKKCNKLIISA